MTVQDVKDYLSQWPSFAKAKLLIIDKKGNRIEVDFENTLYEKGEVKLVGYELKNIIEQGGDQVDSEAE